MTFDRSNLRLIRAEIENALASIAQKHGVEFQLGGMTYADDRFSCKLTALTQNADPEMVRDWKRYAAVLGLNPEWLGQSFTNNGREFAICGLKPRNAKYPVLAKHTGTGSIYKFPEREVILKMSLQESSTNDARPN